jgi:hypothetical protein
LTNDHVSLRVNLSIWHPPLTPIVVSLTTYPSPSSLLCTAAVRLCTLQTRRVSAGRRLQNGAPPVLPALSSSTQASPMAPRGGCLRYRHGAHGGRDSPGRSDHRGPQPCLTCLWFFILEAREEPYVAATCFAQSFLAASSRSATSFFQGVCRFFAAKICILWLIL